MDRGGAPQVYFLGQVRAVRWCPQVPGEAPSLRDDDTQGDGPRSGFRSLSNVSFWTNAICGSRAVKTGLGLQEKPGFGVGAAH